MCFVGKKWIFVSKTFLHDSHYSSRELQHWFWQNRNHPIWMGEVNLRRMLRRSLGIPCNSVRFEFDSQNSISMHRTVLRLTNETLIVIALRLTEANTKSWIFQSRVGWDGENHFRDRLQTSITESMIRLFCKTAFLLLCSLCRLLRLAQQQRLWRKNSSREGGGRGMGQVEVTGESRKEKCNSYIMPPRTSTVSATNRLQLWFNANRLFQ